jgi:CubicO group peptidase (beta-lactamase class C family)
MGMVAFISGVLTATQAAGAGSASSLAIGKTTSADIESYVKQQASASHIPGVAIGIVQGDRATVVRGFGDVGPNTSFFLASLSKSFTSLAIMQLVDAGKVSLSSPVTKYIPWFKVGDGGESDTMTVLQVLDQTSGLSTKAGLTALTFKPTTTLPQAIKGFEAFPLVARPGAMFQYSNANYMVAGYIVERASGQSYESYVEQHIFKPLDMTHSYAMPGPGDEPGLTKGHVTWFGLKVPYTEQVAPALIPDGYIISSASDMTHYLIAQMNDGVYNGIRIVSAKSAQEMHTGIVPLDGQTPVPNSTAYGLGWGVGIINGTAIVSHDGQLRDFQTNMAILPDKNIAVIVLINEDQQLLNEGQIYEGVMQGITLGTLPSISHLFLIFYAIFDLIVVTTIVLMIRSLLRTRKWLQKFHSRAIQRGFRRATARAIGLDAALAVLFSGAVFYGLGAVFGYVPLTPTLMIFAIPDISVWLYLIIAFFVVRALVKAIGIAVTHDMGAAGSRSAIDSGRTGRTAVGASANE